jgi:hypothetical protein
MRMSVLCRSSVVAMVLVVVPFAASVGAAPTIDDSDSSTWVDEPAPGTPLVLKRPARWVAVVDPAELRQRTGAPDVPDVEMRLMIYDPDNGDNAIVNEFTGQAAGWYSTFDEWKQTAKASAASSHGRLLDVGKRTIDGMPVLWEVETYRDPQAGVPIYYSEFEVRTGTQSVVTVALNINKDVPHARRLVMNLIDNIGAQ